MAGALLKRQPRARGVGDGRKCRLFGDRGESRGVTGDGEVPVGRASAMGWGVTWCPLDPGMGGSSREVIAKPSVPLLRMTGCLTSAVDLVSRSLVDHQSRVAYIAYSLSGAMGLPADQRRVILLAGLLHDIGALSLQERLDALVFDSDRGPIERHCVHGYLLLRVFAPFRGVAQIVRHHHTRWDEVGRLVARGLDVPEASHVIHLADRVAVVLGSQKGVLGQAPGVMEGILPERGRKFNPDVVDALRELAEKEYFWLEAASPSISRTVVGMPPAGQEELDLDGMLGVAKLFAKVIDFRSSFTATHSWGVAAVAAGMASSVGFSEDECRLMEVAGYLHDVGKLAVPAEILEKPGQLTEEERSVIRAHSYYTYHVLEQMEGLEPLAQWAAFHHERLDGTGYPFHLTQRELPLGSRIMTVADVFTALTEDRPYRGGLRGEEALDIVRRLARERALDPVVVDVLEATYEGLNLARERAQAAASEEYRDLWRAYEEEPAGG